MNDPRRLPLYRPVHPNVWAVQWYPPGNPLWPGPYEAVEIYVAGPNPPAGKRHGQFMYAAVKRLDGSTIEIVDGQWLLFPDPENLGRAEVMSDTTFRQSFKFIEVVSPLDRQPTEDELQALAARLAHDYRQSHQDKDWSEVRRWSHMHWQAVRVFCRHSWLIKTGDFIGKEFVWVYPSTNFWELYIKPLLAKHTVEELAVMSGMQGKA